MMAEDSELREYTQGDEMRLPVRVQDPSGVQVVYATATREGSNQGGDPQTDQIRLSCGTNPAERGSEPLSLVLQATVTTQSPGVYVCQEIQAIDMLSRESITPLTPPRRFRIVESTEDDSEGPEVLDVGELS